MINCSPLNKTHVSSDYVTVKAIPEEPGDALDERLACQLSVVLVALAAPEPGDACGRVALTDLLEPCVAHLRVLELLELRATVEVPEVLHLHAHTQRTTLIQGSKSTLNAFMKSSKILLR